MQPRSGLLDGVKRQWSDLTVDVRAAQIKSVGAGYPATFVVTMLVVATLLATSRTGRDLAAVACGASALVAVSATTLRSWFAHRRNGWCVADSTGAARALVVQAMATSASWYLLLAAFGLANGGGQRELVDCVMLGVLSTGATRYAAVPVASIAFILAGFASIVLYAFVVGLPAAVFGLLCLFTVLLVRSVVGQAKLTEKHRETMEDALSAAVRGEQLKAGAALARQEEAAAAERSMAAERERSEAAEREAATARHSDLRVVSDAFETSIGPLAAGLTAQVQRGVATARALVDSSANCVSNAARLLPRVRDIGVGNDRLAVSARALQDALDRMSGNVGDQATTATRVGRELDANAAAAEVLGDRAATVEGIVRLIADIAGRTTLLALNASIEAARAGRDAGGFAVVATEVKALSVQTRAAAQEIAGEVAAMRTAIDEVMRGVSTIRSTFNAVPATIAIIDDAMDAQRRLLETIGANSATAAELNAVLDAETRATADEAASAGAHSTELLRAVSDIADDVQRLQESTVRFRSEIEGVWGRSRPNR